MQTPLFLRTVESPDDSPEAPTAFVSSVKAGRDGIPVDSPAIAKLSPRRLSIAKRVRALEDEAFSATGAKAVEIESKTWFDFATTEFGMWLAKRVFLAVCIFFVVTLMSSGPGPVKVSYSAPAHVRVSTSVAPASMDSISAAAARTAIIPNPMLTKLPLQHRLAAMHHQAAFSGSSVIPSIAAKLGKTFSSPLVLRAFHKQIAAIVAEIITFIARSTPDVLAAAASNAASAWEKSSHWLDSTIKGLAKSVSSAVEGSVDRALPFEL